MEFKLLEHKRLSTKACTNFVCDYSSDGRFFVIGETGIFIIELKGQPSIAYPKLASQNVFLKPSSYVPCENVDIDINTFHLDLPRVELYETVCRLEFSGNLKSTAALVMSISSAKWSTCNLVKGNHCALAVLTNLYSLEVYVKHVNKSEIMEYKPIINITEEIIKYFKESWKVADKLMALTRLNELKKRVETVSVTAFCWSPMIHFDDKECCVLFVGHMNGHISVLRIGQIDPFSLERPTFQILGRYETNLERISALHWQQTNYAAGELSIGDVQGKMNLLHVADLDKENTVFTDELPIWQEADSISVDKIIVLSCDTYTFLIIVKGIFLIINAINEKGCIFDRKVIQVANFYITGIRHVGNNDILILSLTGSFKKLKLLVRYNKIHVEELLHTLPIDFARQRTHGLLISDNNILYTIVTSPTRSRDLSKGKSFINLFIFHNTELDPFQMLFNNKSGSLKRYWDCFEALRLICFKEKRFPWVGIDPNLNYDILSLTQLKTLRIISKISETVYSSVPIIGSYDIKPYILLHYLVDIKLAVKRLNKLLSMHNNGHQLTEFQMRSIDIQNVFLKEMVVQDVLAKANVGSTFIDEIYDVVAIANELEYPDMPQCFWCGEKIIGPSCLPPHADTRCSMSMMPMSMIPGYKCPYCKCLVNKELENEVDELLCPYCDISLDKQYLTNSGNIDQSSKDIEEEIRSDCYLDCTKETSSCQHVDGNSMEVVLFSDSEEDSSDLQQIYDNLQNLSCT